MDHWLGGTPPQVPLVAKTPTQQQQKPNFTFVDMVGGFESWGWRVQKKANPGVGGQKCDIISNLQLPDNSSQILGECYLQLGVESCSSSLSLPP